jgi:hypothetical protein
MNGWRIFSREPGAASGRSERECAVSSPAVRRFADCNRRPAVAAKVALVGTTTRTEIEARSFDLRPIGAPPPYCAAFAKNPALSRAEGVYQPPGKIIAGSALFRSGAVSCSSGASEKANEFMSTKLSILSAISGGAALPATVSGFVKACENVPA